VGPGRVHADSGLQPGRSKIQVVEIDRAVCATTTHKRQEYIQQNADVDFEIEGDDMKYLDGMSNTGKVTFGPKSGQP